MRRSIIALVFAIFVAPVARADDTLLMAAGGIGLKLSDDGKIGWVSTKVIPLDDGRVVRREGDVWKLDPPQISDIRRITPIDLAVYHQDLGGRRVSFSGEMHSASVVDGTIRLPGSVYANVDFSLVPRDLVKQLIERCGDIPLGARPVCTVDVVATVEPRPNLDRFRLIEAEVKFSVSKPRP